MVRYHNITENSDHSSEEALDLDLPPRPPRLPDQDSNNGKKKAKKNFLFKLFCGILGFNGIIFILAVIGIILGGYCAVELHSQNLRQNDFDLRLAHVEKKVDEVSDLVSCSDFSVLWTRTSLYHTECKSKVTAK